MEEWDFYLDFEDGVLTYQYDRGVVVYSGGYAPSFKVEGVWVRGHCDPDYPICLFAEELEGDEYFLNDPIDCNSSGVVLLGSGKEVLLHTLSKNGQDCALRQMSVTAFQRAIPFEIKERLLTVCSSRWKLYELFAYVPESMPVFDRNPALAMLLANAGEWRKESTEQLRKELTDLLHASERDPVVDEKVLKWLGVLKHTFLLKVLSAQDPCHLSVESLRVILELQNNPTFFEWLAKHKAHDHRLIKSLAQKNHWLHLSSPPVPASFDDAKNEGLERE